MGSASIIALLAILFFPQLTTVVMGNFLSPLFSPDLDDVCKDVECGKGTCKPSPNSTFLFVCECNPGWTQTRTKHDHHFMFLPCVIPNCTLDYSCSHAPSPIQEEVNPASESIFELCNWTYCGGGSCNKTSTFKHSCECKEGYFNLLNISSLPCYRECALGADCSGLGFTVSNKSNSPTPSSLADDANQASSVLRRDFYWLIILMIPLALIQ